ncbi:MAG: DUF4102 domain-containing protein, partial [Acetobacteraceae bacterium]|nr:DUF4102 domain-containing protein [Acetobacteraceae bacterium]
MAKAAKRLNTKSVASLIGKGRPARYADGGNLYLHVTGPGRALWSFRYMRQGKAREMGLGVADPEGKRGLDLATARERAAEALRLLRDGLAPIERRGGPDAAAGGARPPAPP